MIAAGEVGNKKTTVGGEEVMRKEPRDHTTQGKIETRGKVKKQARFCFFLAPEMDFLIGFYCLHFQHLSVLHRNAKGQLQLQAGKGREAGAEKTNIEDVEQRQT